MLPQEQMIARVRALCRADDRLDAAMMYGSFAYGEGDAFSDIEFLLFFRDEAFAEIAPRAWLDQIAPVELLYVNEFGIHVAIFDALIRGEFHFHRVADLGIAQAWPGVITFPTLDSTLIADKSGRLTPLLEPIIGPPIDRANRDTAQRLADGFVDKMLFGYSVLRRGEYARALEMLGVVHRLLLGMARLLEGATDHWLTPARRAEQDLSPEAYARFRDCAVPLDPDALWRAYRAAWQWGGEMLAALRARFEIAYSDDLLARITNAMR